MSGHDKALLRQWSKVIEDTTLSPEILMETVCVLVTVLLQTNYEKDQHLELIADIGVRLNQLQEILTIEPNLDKDKLN